MRYYNPHIMFEPPYTPEQAAADRAMAIRRVRLRKHIRRVLKRECSDLTGLDLPTLKFIARLITRGVKNVEIQ